MQLKVKLYGGKEFLPAKDYNDTNDFWLEFVDGVTACNKRISFLCIGGEVVEIHPNEIEHIERYKEL